MVGEPVLEVMLDLIFYLTTETCTNCDRHGRNEFTSFPKPLHFLVRDSIHSSRISWEILGLLE